MRSLAEGLPPEVARQVHPEWRRNEAEYWEARDELLTRYKDQWVAFADGEVIVAGGSAVDVLHRGQASGRHPYVVCVGRDHEPCPMRQERLLGRDVLNRLEVLFRGPAGEVVVNP